MLNHLINLLIKFYLAFLTFNSKFSAIMHSLTDKRSDSDKGKQVIGSFWDMLTR